MKKETVNYPIKAGFDVKKSTHEKEGKANKAFMTKKEKPLKW
jgi:hypothetical protein